MRGVIGLSGARERGAISLEGAGAILVAAMVVGTVSLSVAGPDNRVGRAVGAAACQIVTVGQGDCAPVRGRGGESDRTPAEPCMVNASGYEASMMAAAGVKADDGSSWLVEQLSDGTYRVTRGNSGGPGAEGGSGFDVGVTVRDAKLGATASAGGDGAFNLGSGQVYYAKDQSAVDKVFRAHVTESVADSVAGVSIPFLGIKDSMRAATKAFNEWQLPEPDEQFFAGGVSGDAEATATLLVTNGGGGLGVSNLMGTKVKSDGSMTTYYDATFTGNASVGSLLNAADGEGGVTYDSTELAGRIEGRVEVERGADGNVTAVTASMLGDNQMGAGAGNGSKIRQGTITLPVKTAKDEEVAAEFLGSLNLGLIPGLPSAVPNPAAGMVDPTRVYDGVKNFAAASLDRGTATVQDLVANSDDYEATFDAKALLKAAVGGGVVVNNVQTDAGQYFNGSGWSEWDACSS